MSNFLWSYELPALQASLSFTNFWSLLKFMSIESLMPSNHLVLCHLLLLLPSIFWASGSFLSQLLALGGQSIGASVSASVLPMNSQDWFPLECCFNVKRRQTLTFYLSIFALLSPLNLACYNNRENRCNLMASDLWVSIGLWIHSSQLLLKRGILGKLWCYRNKESMSVVSNLGPSQVRLP